MTEEMKMLDIRTLILWSAAAAFIQPAEAEIPTHFYIDMQKYGPESLTIKVLDSQIKQTRGADFLRSDIKITAEVLDVERSKAKLKKGSIVKITWTSTYWKVSPPGADLLLAAPQKGKVFPAFLETNPESPSEFVPGAGKWTFERLKEDAKYKRLIRQRELSRLEAEKFSPRPSPHDMSK